jgi:C-terminal processing protease CtpA/Prc
MLRTYGYQLLSGDADEPVKLHLRDAAGRVHDELVPRSGYQDLTEGRPFQFRSLPNKVAYIALDHFESDQGVKAFEAALPHILNARALVIDVRSNGGGSTQFGLQLLSYLSRRPIAGLLSFQRVETSLDRTQGKALVRWAPVAESGRPFEQTRERIFEAPVAVLIGAQTFSAAEDFVVAFESMKRGITVGEPTGGSTGQPLTFALPGGGFARVCVKRDVSPDGREFVGRGIEPTFEVKPTVADVRAGKDPVLELAVQRLTQAK